MSRPIHRLVLVFVLGLVLLAPWAASAQPRSAGVHFVTTRSLSAPADLLAQAWAFVSRLWDKEGCGIDPSGGEAGCGIDPDGRNSTTQPTPPTQGEAGCGIDPNGLCTK